MLSCPKLSQFPLILVTAACCLPGFTLGLPLASGQTSTPSPTAPGEAKNERRVVLVVWDGLRPDSVNDEFTPTLARLSREGVFFTRHHPVYPSMTEVNGTALATGCYPAHSGLIGNVEYRPAINPLKPVATESLATIRQGDELTGGRYLRVPTLPELLHAAGVRTEVAGTKGVAALMDRAERPDLAPTDHFDEQSVTLFGGEILGTSFLRGEMSRAGGVFPQEIHFPNIEQDRWTTEALTTTLWNTWPAGPPKLSVLWMSDPDYTQHQFGPDSPQAHRALASVDGNLAKLLERLEQLHLRETTDVLVVSDHGFSTIGRRLDLAKLLAAAGFNAAREFTTPPKTGDIMVDGLGGSVYLYVVGHDAGTTRRLVTFLQESDFAGVILTRAALPGTFALNAVHIDSADAPDVVVAMRWNDDKNAAGFPGLVVSDGGRKPGQGTHATLSRFDMHNTLIAAGPDFKPGWRDDLPSGNVDLAPTIAHLLGLPKPAEMDGRVLSEALNVPTAETPAPPRTERVEALQDTGKAQWSQYLQITRYGGVDYFDEGNCAGQVTIAP